MKLTYDIKDHSYSDKESDNYYLITYLSDSSLVLLVYDIRSNKYILLKVFDLPGIRMFRKQENLTDLIPELKLNYQKRITVISNPSVTIVPSEFYSPELAVDYFKLNYDLNDKENIRYDYIKNLNSYLVYLLNPDYQVLDKVLKPDRIYHSATAFITGILTNIENYLSNKIFVDIEQSFIRIAVLNEGKLQLFNSFYYKNPEDVLYHLLNVSSRFDVNPDRDKYLLSGRIMKDTDVYKLLFRHIRYPLLAHRINNFLYSKVFDSVPYHIFYSTFAVTLCE